MVIGLAKIKFSKGVCQGCILGKHPEHKFEKASHERTSAPLEFIRSDVAALLSTQMALLHLSADTSYVGTQKDTYGLKVA